MSWQTIAVSPNSLTAHAELASANSVLTSGTFRICGGDSDWQSNDMIKIDDITIADYVKNPDLDASCGIDVDVILDESGSINSADAVDEVEDAHASPRPGARRHVVEPSPRRVLDQRPRCRDRWFDRPPPCRRHDAHRHQHLPQRHRQQRQPRDVPAERQHQ
ncbi:MAG: hypothetical protein R2697_16415 [Ilumatobacteraceae bacterium]